MEATMVNWIWAAGGIQVAILLANFVLPRRLAVRENLHRISPILRQVFVVHWGYILLVLVIFAALCFGFAPELAGGSLLGRFLSGAMGIFWLLRFFLQLLYYDATARRKFPLLDAMYCGALLFLAAVFGYAALGVGA